MRSNKKKLLSVILGFMASISGTSAVMKLEKDTKSTNTEMMSKSKKRNQEGPGLGRNVAELIFAVFTGNEILSNLPVVKGFTYPLLRPWLSNYRVRRNVRGEFIRSNGPSSTNYCYTISNESDHDYYRLKFLRSNSFYIKNEYTGKYTLKDNFLKKIDTGNIESIKSQNNLFVAKIYGFHDIGLVMEDDKGNILSGSDTSSIGNFFKSDNYDASDAADALSKVLEFVNVINSNKSYEDRVNLINKQFDVVFCSRTENNPLPAFRILVKERENAKGQMRKIFAEFRLKEEKIKEEIEAEGAEKLEQGD